jgi:hypothetical protein
MGNPAQANWPNFTNYVIALLPQLDSLDGTEITKSMRIVARQHLPEYEVSLPRTILLFLVVTIFITTNYTLEPTIPYREYMFLYVLYLS